MKKLNTQLQAHTPEIHEKPSNNPSRNSSGSTQKHYEKPTFECLGGIGCKTGFLGYTPDGATSCTPLGS